MKKNDPWAKMDAIIAAEKAPEGDGWFTVKDMTERYNLKKTACLRRLNEMKRNGAVEVWTGFTNRGYASTKYRMK
jgi:DNA-binding IscR family transcriptional regulator